MKHIAIILTLGIIFLYSCNNTSDEINGYWYGNVKIKEAEFQRLVYFNHGECKLKITDFDFLNYEIRGNHIEFYSKTSGEAFAFKYKIDKDSLFIKNNSIELSLKKLNKNLAVEFLNRDSIKIQLPNYKIETATIFELDMPADYFVYILKKNDFLEVKYLDKIYSFNLSTFILIREHLLNIVNDRLVFYLYVDKNLNSREFKELTCSLRLCYLLRPKIMLGATSMDSFNYFQKNLAGPTINEYMALPDSLRELVNKPPPAPGIMSITKDYVRTHPFIILRNDSIDNKKYTDKIKAKIRAFPTSYLLLIDINNTADFDSYIHQYAEVHRILDEIKDEIAMKHLVMFSNIV